MDALTYDKAAQDIVASIGRTDSEAQVLDAAKLTFLASSALAELCAVQGGYLLLCMFIVSFTEMKKVLATTQGKDKALIQQVMEAVIGSFGKVVQ